LGARRMIKKKIPEKRKKFSKSIALDESRFEEHKPLDYLLNKKNILRGIAECLDENDLQGIIEIITIHKRALRR
jgi:hypothetical protein